VDDLPILNWWKIHETGDYSYLLHKRRLLTSHEKSLGATIFRRIYEEFIQRFGLSQDFLDQLELRRQIGILKADRWLTGDKSLMTMIRVLEAELKAKIELTMEMEFFEMKAELEIQLGFTLDPAKVSVAEFYSYFKTLDKNGRKRQGKA
jgi:hypothetical protein